MPFDVAAPGLVLVPGVSLLPQLPGVLGQQLVLGNCVGTSTAFKMSSTPGLQHRRREGSGLGSTWGVHVAGVAAGLVAQQCVAVQRGASWCWALRGPLHPAEGHCSSSHCSPGTCQLLLQELFGFAAEIAVLGKPCAMGPAASATSDGCAKDGRGLRGSRRALETLGMVAVLPCCPG